MPRDAAQDVPIATQVLVAFDAPLEPSSVSSATVEVRAGASPVSGSLAYDQATGVVAFTPWVALDYSTVHAVHISSSVHGANGMGLAAPYSFSFTTAPDTTAPFVLAVAPLDGSTRVGTSATIAATFGEAVDPSSLTSSSFSLSCGNAGVAASLEYDPGFRTATLVPAAPLPYLASCIATITAAVTDVSGNHLAPAFSWSFVVVPDEVPPTIVRVAPLDGATGIALGALVSATFDEALDPATVSTATVRLVAGDLDVPALVSWDEPTRTITVTPAAPLANLTRYTVTAGTGLADVSGNSLAAPFGWSFTTVPDTIPPGVLEIFPSENATSVSIATAVRVTFDEPIDPASVTTSSFGLGGWWSAVPASVAYDAATRTATLTPATPLAYFAMYTATLTTDIADLAGNHPAAGRSWSFWTEQDLVRPTVVSMFPEAGAAGVPTSTTVGACFSEPMLPLPVLAIDGVTVSEATWDSSRRCISATASLPNGVTVTATVGSARDLAANPLQGPSSWRFTVAPDTTAPTVLSVAPVPGARFVSPLAPVSVTFDEPVDETSLAQHFTVTGVSGTVAMQGSTTAVFTPAAPLPAGTTFTATVTTGVTDVVGNALAAPYTFSFRTAPATTARLSVNSPAFARSPVLAYDASGDAMAAWLIDTGTGASLATSYRPVGQGWTPEVVIDVAPEGGFSDLNLVAQGDRFGIGYTRTTAGATQVVLRFAADGTWDAGTAFNGSGRLRLVAGSSTWLAAWGTDRPAVTVWSSGGWSAPQGVSELLWGGSLWAIAASGDSFVVVNSAAGGLMEAHVWNGLWGPYKILSDLLTMYGGTAGSLAISSGPTGVVVAWTYTGTTTPATSLVVSRVLSGGSWGPVQVLSSTPGAAATGLLAASSSTSHAVTYAIGGGLYVAMDAGGTWSVESVPGGDGPASALVANDSGLAISWAGTGGSSVSVRTSGWEDPLPLPGAARLALEAGLDGFACAYDTGTTVDAIVHSQLGWGPAAQLGGASSALSVTRSPGGFGLAWSRGGAVRTSEFGVAWGAPTDLMTLAYPASVLEPHIAVNAGRAVVAWLQPDASSGANAPTVLAATYDGSGWSAPISLDPGGGRAPDVVAAGPDEFVVSWMGGTDLTAKLRRYSFTTGIWSATSAIGAPSSDGTVGVAYTGTEYVAAFDISGAIFGVTSADGGTWGPAQNVGAGSAPRLVSGGGRTLLVTRPSTGGGFAASVLEGAGAWGDPLLLATAGTPRAIASAADGDGALGVTFQEDVQVSGIANPVPTVRARLWAPTTWSALDTLGTGFDPRMSARGQRWLVTWLDYWNAAVLARTTTAPGTWGPTLRFGSQVGGQCPASTSSSQHVLVTQNPAPPGRSGPVVYSVADGFSSAGDPLDTDPGYFVDALLAADRSGTAMVAAWTRADPTTAARVLMATVDP